MSDNITISKSFLLSGKDLQITDSLTVKHPTVQEVLDIDEKNSGLFSEYLYYSWVSVFMCDPYNYMVYLDDKKIDYETISPFNLFIMLYQDMITKYEDTYKTLSEQDYLNVLLENQFFKAFKFFLNKDYFMIAKDENGEFVIGDVDTGTVMIDEKIYLLISDFIKKINGIQEIDKINPEDDFAKQILIEDERSKIKKLLKQTEEKNESNRLGNLLSSVTWGSNGGVTPFNRNNLHMYDLVDGADRTDKLLNFNHIMTGLYSGCVDKDKLDMQKISWQL